MDKQYYIVVNEQRVGPLTYSQLGDRGLEPSTLVWTAGLADWTRADSIPELAPLIARNADLDGNESAFGSYARSENPVYPGYGQRQDGACGYHQPQQPPQYDSYRPSGVNWKTIAIIATVCGFLFSCIGGIVGIFGIISAGKAEDAQRFGNDFEAQSQWSTCRTLTIVSLVLSGVGLIANIAVFSKIAGISLLN